MSRTAPSRSRSAPSSRTQASVVAGVGQSRTSAGCSDAAPQRLQRPRCRAPRYANSGISAIVSSHARRSEPGLSSRRRGASLPISEHPFSIVCSSARPPSVAHVQQHPTGARRAEWIQSDHDTHSSRASAYTDGALVAAGIVSARGTVSHEPISRTPPGRQDSPKSHAVHRPFITTPSRRGPITRQPRGISGTVRVFAMSAVHGLISGRVTATRP